jgi:hypothetical protein
MTSIENTTIVSGYSEVTEVTLEVLPAPQRPSRVDDKAAALEESVEHLKAEFRKERFVYIFIIGALFDTLMLAVAPGMASSFVLIATIILLIGLAKWLEFPWVTELEGWHNRLISFWHSKTNTKPEIEPPP